MTGALPSLFLFHQTCGLKNDHLHSFIMDCRNKPMYLLFEAVETESKTEDRF